MRRTTIKASFPRWTEDTKVSLHSWDKKNVKVDAFACACGGKFAMEVETFLLSVRAHHDENIYLLVDKSGARVANATIEKYSLENVIIFEEIDEEYSKRVEKLSKNIATHNNYWSITWIYAKLDVFLRAIQAEKGKGVILLDGDIILTKPITQEWESTAVFSAHSLTKPMRKNYETYGFWNAGMVLCNNPSFVKHWMKLFLDGGPNSFYEQKCMEDLASKWVIDVFPESFNMGKWRREDISMSGRSVSSFHLHHNEGDQYPEQPFIHRVAKRAIMDNRITVDLRKDKMNKLAFIHVPRTAGTYIREYIKYEGVSKRRSVQVLDSWIMRLDREWTETELKLIANNQLMGQEKGGRYFVHNHTFGWSWESVKEMKENGFLTFSFLRPVEDVICSCWYYHLRHKDEYNVIWHREKARDSRILNDISNVNDAIVEFLTDKDLLDYWRLPEWFGEVEQVMKWSEERFASFLKYFYQFDYIPTAKANSTKNPGFKALVESGEIKQETIDLLNQHSDVIRWREFFSRAS